MKEKISRRGLFNRAATVAVGFAGLSAFQGRAYAQGATGFGPLVPDPDGLLDLPKGFKYTLFSTRGELMGDGFRVPGAHDGMAAYPGPDGLTILVRNHELEVTAAGATGSPYVTASAYNAMDKAKVYDVGTTAPASGGTTNVLYDTRLKKCVGHHLSLTGTIRNCAGGATPWNSWLTCEETGVKAGQTNGGSVMTKDHGWVYDVPAVTTPGLVDPVPLKALGRMSHEAVAMVPPTGYVYLTEDQGNSAFYRFIPAVPSNSVASLLSGKLQALKILGFGQQNTNNRTAPLFPSNTPFEVEWVDLTDVESPNDNLRTQAQSKGCAIFSRGEGIWYGNGAIYFACTDGGAARIGQIFKYTPSPAEGTAGELSQPNRPTIQLFIEPTNASQFAAPDNITVAPNGDVIVCEDGSGDEFVHGVTSTGLVYKIARNTMSEFAGACFSPDGTTLFVNVQGPGYTFAITGPWHRRVA